MPDSLSQDPIVAAKAGGRRRGAFMALGAIIIIGGIVWATYTYLVAANRESTDDAYVSGDVVQINAEVSGTAIALHADDTQRVKAGDLLIELDPADAKVAMGSAEAGLAQAVRNVKALQAQSDQLEAQIAEREADLRRAQDDAKRRAALIQTGAVSREDFAHAQDNSTTQTASLAAARAELAQTLAKLGDTSIAANPDVLAAAAKLRDAALALRRTEIFASVDGIVAKRTVEVGQHVDPGTPLMAIIPLENVWVDANFKEVQLRRMRAGQKAHITTDLYGSTVTYDGTIAGLSAGSGTAFALLPPQNATGNWIKIIQRVPVRVLIDPAELKQHPLRIGLSTDVSVDVGAGGDEPIGAAVRNQPFPAKKSDGDDPSVDALIARIIAENGGASATAAAGAEK
jgi:membrane fusion protein (multidrug efflux system)